MVAKTRSGSSLPLPSVHSPSKRSKGARSGKAPARRKLFPGACSEMQPAVGAFGWESSLEPEDMDRQDSGTSTQAGAPASEEAAPSTPEQHQAAGRRAQLDAVDPLFQALEQPLLLALQSWERQLVRLQPLVQLGGGVLLGALAIMRALVAARPDLALCLHASDPHLYTYQASAMWLVAKLCGVRTQIPNRSLMSQATQVHPQALSDFELDLLASLDWDVAAILRQHGLLC